ncbi:Probable glucose-1-phosphate adenylyltransferase [Mycobacteroides abscessus subsp. abscessus]|nr:Probable glucose-1-phosphate adenylyltransferase [Mycobacteroides abscessus subsp. abscessus]
MSDPFPTTHSPATVALILAGGKGSRLSPLTDARSKPSVPFGGGYQIIDVVLSNLAHSRIRDVWIAEQYRPFTLNKHLAGGRPWDLDGTRHGLQILPPAEGRAADGFAEGNGHALYQQVPLLQSFRADTVVVLSADHLYQMDFRLALEQHERLGSDLTIITTETDEDPSRFGVVQTGKNQKVTGYDYKPENPQGNLVATEIFIFKVEALSKAVDHLVKELDEYEDHDEPKGASLGDYGETILPYFVKNKKVHEFRHTGYWRDIGTIDAYYKAHMELLEGKGLNLDDPGWAVITHHEPLAPARFYQDSHVSHSMIAHGCHIHGDVSGSIIGPGVTIEADAKVSRSILLGDLTVPAGAVLESVIADVFAEIPAGQTGKTKPGPGNITVLVPSQRGADVNGQDQTLGE